MVACSQSTELSTSLTLTLRYKTYHVSGVDTSILYTVMNNVSAVSGQVKVSANTIFDNNMTNSQPYLKVNKVKSITSGFDGDQAVKLNGGNKFVADTLMLNFYVDPGATPFNMSCKYKKL